MEYKTCLPTLSRQSLDVGNGTIHVPASYGKDSYDNDSCSDVRVGDCPTGYKILPTGNSHTEDIDEDHAVPDSVLSSDDCWKGGNTSGKGGRTTHGISTGVYGSYQNRSDAGGRRNNYSKPCFKDASGWTKTNPVNGWNLNYNNQQDNKNACCGFKKSVRDTVEEHYCDPQYCFKKGPQDNDDISQKCSTHLLSKCERWGFIVDDFGFEDYRCSDPLSQIAGDSDKSTVTDAKRSMFINKLPASITSDEYSSIGADLCTVQDFMNNKAPEGSIKKRKYEKCIKWCRDNSNECSGIIRDVCGSVYSRTNKFPDTFPDDIKEYEGICACNWPQDFYDSIVAHYIKTYNVTEAALNSQRKCLYGPCGASSIGHYDSTDNNETCPDKTFISCVQNLEIDFTGSEINDVTIDAGQEQKCGTLGDTGAGAGAGAGAGQSPTTPGSTDSILPIIIALGIFIFLLFGGMGFILVKG